jgi:hypothetical protein
MKSFARQVGPIRLSSILNEPKNPGGFLTFCSSRKTKSAASRAHLATAIAQTIKPIAWVAHCFTTSLLLLRLLFRSFAGSIAHISDWRGLREKALRGILVHCFVFGVYEQERQFLQVLYLTRVRLETGTRRRLCSGVTYPRFH